MLAPVLVTPPAALAVSLVEAKAHLRVTYASEDSTIGIYLAAAIARLDGWAGILGRCLVTQTWRQDREGFWDVIDLPFPAVSAVTVLYSDDANVERTLDPANYRLVNGNGRSWIEIAASGSFPSTFDRPDAVRITLTCGYGAATDVPAPLKAAILLHVGVQFAGRAEGELPPAYHALIAPYRVVGV